MKIQPINHSFTESAQTKRIIDKINEIIDVLNNSFITSGPGEELDAKQLSTTTVYTDLTCDCLNPLPNEHTLKDNQTDITAEIMSDGVDILRMIEENPITDKKCPHCGRSYYTPEESYTTAVYCPPIYKDGVNINKLRNRSTSKYHCLACGEDWVETT